MGEDDRNEGTGEGECPAHQWQFEEAVPTAPSEFGLVGLNVVETCSRCGAVRYQPSAFERL